MVHPGLRFSLFTSLAVAAGFLGGYRWGDRVGDRHERLGTCYAKSYDVSDLVGGTTSRGAAAASANFDELIDLVVREVEPDSWMENGGPSGEIEALAPQGRLSVSNTGYVHDQIEALLTRWRSEAANGSAVDATRAMQHLAATRDIRSRIAIRRARLASWYYDPTATDCFTDIVDAVSKLWGPPTLCAAVGELEFPQWSTGKHLAAWHRNGGLAFIEEHDFFRRSLAGEKATLRGLFVGWHTDNKAYAKPAPRWCQFAPEP